MTEPQIIQCASDCTVTVVHEISLPLFNLTSEQGGQIAVAVAAVWSIAFLFRQAIRMVQNSTEVRQPDER